MDQRVSCVAEPQQWCWIQMASIAEWRTHGDLLFASFRPLAGKAHLFFPHVLLTYKMMPSIALGNRELRRVMEGKDWLLTHLPAAWYKLIILAVFFSPNTSLDCSTDCASPSKYLSPVITVLHSIPVCPEFHNIWRSFLSQCFISNILLSSTARLTVYFCSTLIHCHWLHITGMSWFCSTLCIVEP